MMTVRFPDGTSIQYNTANYCVYQANCFELSTAKGGTWIVSVPYASGGAIESVPACRIYKAASDQDVDRLTLVEKDIRGLRRDIKALAKKK
jgi:hypothetical protein